MSSLYHLKGFVPDTSCSADDESSFEHQFEPVPIRYLQHSRDVVLSTPPRNADCHGASGGGAYTPTSAGDQTVGCTEEEEDSESYLNLTAACSPAYRDRRSIAREDMANFTFFLDHSHEASPTINRHCATPRIPAIARIRGEVTPKSATTTTGAGESPFFEISSYVSMLTLSSPRRSLFSSTALNNHLQSTPSRSPIRNIGIVTPTNRTTYRLQTNTRNYFGTPTPQQ